MKLYASGYTDCAKSFGIYLFDMDSSGKLTLLHADEHSVNPSYLAIGNNFLYAVNETDTDSKIDTYEISRNHEKINYISSYSIESNSMCHINLFDKMNVLAISNYGSGNFHICSLDDNSLPNNVIFSQTFKGVGFYHNGRQNSSHIHSTAFSPNGDKMIVVDLGLDKLYLYSIDTLRSNNFVLEQKILLPNGEGPRMGCFSHDGKFFYVLTELGNKLFVYNLENQAVLEQCINILPENYTSENLAADIQLSNDGKFIYVSNRGFNHIVCFSVDKLLGTVQHCFNYCIPGEGVRSFCMSPNGDFFVIACQKTDEILVYERNTHTGTFEKLFEKVSVPNITFVKLV